VHRAILGKNGSDVTTAAARAARAATGRSKLLRAVDNPVKNLGLPPAQADSFKGPAYHGATSGWLASKAGVLAAESSVHEIGFTYNDLESVESALDTADGDCAAIFVGGCSYPYSGPTEEPTFEFAKGLRDLADAHGAMLVLDEIRTNFRVGSGLGPGHWAELADDGTDPLSFAPDMHCMCKALANGHPLAALVGNAAAREGAAAITASGTYWLSAPPMAAALATLNEIETHGHMNHMQAMGIRLREGLEGQAAQRGIDVTVSGPPAMPFMTFEVDDLTPNTRAVALAWCAAAAEKGVWLHPFHNWYITAAHSAGDIDQTLTATEFAFDACLPLLD
jgi:glutamate-1-semialdehyde 2,1-aminomutase